MIAEAVEAECKPTGVCAVNVLVIFMSLVGTGNVGSHQVFFLYTFYYILDFILHHMLKSTVSITNDFSGLTKQ